LLRQQEAANVLADFSITHLEWDVLAEPAPESASRRLSAFAPPDDAAT
jgi:hypothetical protein